MAIPLIQDEPSLEYYDKYLAKNLENTFSDTISAAFESGKSSTMGGYIDDIMEMKDLRSRSSRVVSPQELNETYRETGLIFRESMPDLVAEEIVKRNRERRAIQERISMGPSGLSQGAANVLSSLAGGVYGSFTTPVDLAINVIAAPFTVGRIGAMGLQAGKLAFLAKGGVTGMVLRGAAEGAVTGLVSTPLLAKRDMQEGKDFSAMDALSNYGQEIFTSAAFPVAVHGLKVGGQKVFGKMRNSWNYFRRSDMGGPTSGLFAVDQLAAGKRPSIRPLSALFEKQMSGAAETPDFSGRTQYKSTEIGDLSQPVSGRFFLASSGTADVPVVRSGSPYDVNFGEGVYLTNGAKTANNVVLSSFNANGNGRIFDAEIENARLYDAERSLDPLTVDSIMPALIGTGIKRGEFSNLREVFDALDSLDGEGGATARQKVNEAIRGLGYDGYAIDGVNGSDNHAIMLFDEARAKIGEAYEPDRRLLQSDINKEAEEHAAYINSQESDLFHNPEKIAHYERAKGVEPSQVKSIIDQRIEEERAELLGRLKELDSQGLLSDGERALIAQIRGDASASRADADGDASVSNTRELMNRAQEVFRRFSAQGDVALRDTSSGVISFRAPPGSGGLFSNRVSELKIRINDEKLNVGEARPYLGLRQKEGEPFAIMLKNFDERHRVVFNAVDKNGRILNSLSAVKGRGGANEWSVSLTTELPSDWRGSGVGAALYKEFARQFDGNVRPDMSGSTSRAAWASWKKNLPEQWKAHVMDFAQRWKRGQEIRGYEHVMDDVHDARAAIKDGKEWNPEGLGINEDGTPAPMFPLSMGREVRVGQGRSLVQVGESVIKGLFSCIERGSG